MKSKVLIVAMLVLLAVAMVSYITSIFRNYGKTGSPAPSPSASAAEAVVARM